MKSAHDKDDEGRNLCVRARAHSHATPAQQLNFCLGQMPQPWEKHHQRTTFPLVHLRAHRLVALVFEVAVLVVLGFGLQLNLNTWATEISSVFAFILN